MPFAGFIRPDGQKESVDDALAHAREVYGLPRGLLKALALGERVQPPGDISVTQLIDPLRKAVLQQRHEYHKEPLDMLWAVFGKAIHSVVETGADAKASLTEERIHVDLEGLKLSGQADLYELDNGRARIADYKSTSVYKIKAARKEGARDWEQQLNCYAYLYRSQGFEVHELEVVAIVRDHRNYEAIRAAEKSDFYPSEIHIFEVPVWTNEAVETFARRRLVEFRAEREKPDHDLTFCTDEETWNGRRCARWCPIRDHCNQYQATKGISA